MLETCFKNNDWRPLPSEPFACSILALPEHTPTPRLKCRQGSADRFAGIGLGQTRSTYYGIAASAYLLP